MTKAIIIVETARVWRAVNIRNTRGGYLGKISAVLFDYDDTLAATYSPRVLAAEKAADGLLPQDLDMDRVMRKWAGRPQMEIFKDLAGDEDLAKELFDRYTAEYWRLSPTHVKLFPGIREMLETLRSRGFRLGIVTSKPRLLKNDDGPFGVELELQRMDLMSTFDVIVGWEDPDEPKPAPAPILFALDKMGLAPGDAAMVGDSHIDITTAKNAGTVSIGATWGTLARDMLVETGPDHLIDSPDQLLPLLS
ncbi:MAG: HAD family hydrolase [Chloroflexi bacterium]|nr:HAD family hydrolase [Chloroflexota bacterium]